MCRDPEKNRARKARYRKARKRFRIPDWCVKGECRIDYDSPWLIENRSRGAQGYALSLLRERKEARR